MNSTQQTQSSANEHEQALRWLLANRQPGITFEQAVRTMRETLPYEPATMQLLRRIAEENQAKTAAAQ